MRRVIRLGDRTSHGGYVVSATSRFIVMDKPVARLVREKPPLRQRRQPGNCIGMITLLVEDDEHLEGFEE